jgi:hypothetical protein
MAVAQCTEWRRHGPYSDEATWWLWRAFFNEVFTYRGAREMGTHRKLVHDGGQLALVFSNGAGHDPQLSSLTKTTGSFPLMFPRFS